MLALSAILVLQKPQYTTPAAGTKLRAAILDTLRKPIEKDLGVKVKFRVDIMRLKEPWVFVGGLLLDQKNKEIDLLKTKLKKDAEYMDGPSYYALLKRGAKNTWKTTAFVIGPTDVAFDDWDTRYGCPRVILGFRR